MKKLKIALLLGAVGMLSSCDLTQMPGLSKKLSPEDSKAIGAACRHSGRALEDCFTLNPDALQAGVFEGWRDMNDYMTANKIDTVEPKVEVSKFKKDAAHADEGHAESKPESAAAGSGAEAQAGRPAMPTPSGDASGRPRWEPGQPTARTPGAPEGQAATRKPDSSSGHAPEAGAGSPARPWERKADSKNTT